MRSLLTALMFTLMVAPGFAGMTTISTPLVLGTNDTHIDCDYVNVSTKTIASLTVSIVSVGGTVFSTTSTSQLPPQGGTGLEGSPIGFLVRCVFTFSGSPKSIRGALEVIDGTTRDLKAALPAT